MEEILIQKSKLKANAIRLSEYQGKPFLQIMEMWKSQETDDWQFSKKNVTFNAASIVEFFDALEINKEEIINTLCSENGINNE